MAIFHFHSILHTQGDFFLARAVLHTDFGASVNVDKDPGPFCTFRAAAEKLCLVFVMYGRAEWSLGNIFASPSAFLSSPGSFMSAQKLGMPTILNCIWAIVKHLAIWDATNWDGGCESTSHKTSGWTLLLHYLGKIFHFTRYHCPSLRVCSVRTAQRTVGSPIQVSF